MKNKIGLIMLTILTISMLAALPIPAIVYGNGQAGTTLENASVTATGYWTITYGWTITKSVEPSVWHLFKGDRGTSQYTITVTKDSGTVEAWIEGQVSVTNEGKVATENLQIVVKLYNGYPPPDDYLTEVEVDVSSNPILDPGETGYYNYRINIPITEGTHSQPKPGGTYKVTAKITITNHSGSLGTPKGPSPSATCSFPRAPTKVNDVIYVDDTNGGSWTFSASGSVSYTKTFTAPDDEGTHTNTATIRETGRSDSATVTVNCYALDISKNAETSFNRTYTWTINKKADKSELTLEIGETYDVNYEVTVDATYEDSDWTVSGTITVYNPAPIPVKINSITDVVSPDIAAAVNFGVTFPYTLSAGGTLTGTYTTRLPDAKERINTVTVTIQNYDYDCNKNPTEADTTDFTATADVDFSNAEITEIDESVTVSDNVYGKLGEVSYGDAPETFEYSLTIGPYYEPGEYEFVNTASFVACDTRTIGIDSWEVTVNVPTQPEMTYLIYGWKFYDVNADGEFDGNEEELSDWTIQLLDKDGNVIETTTTGEDGSYSFEVAPGTYTVREVMQNGWINTTPIEVTVTVVSANFEVNFGNIRRIMTNARTIGYWKNWLSRFSNDYVLSLANGIKADWDTFDSIKTDSAANARKDMIGILDGANAKDMSVMLKAQLLGMMLNIKAGYVNPDTYVYLGSISGASALFGGDFKKAGEIVSFIDSNWQSWSRSQQGIAKNVLDAMNNNRIFVG